jgi:hypothetical protein
MAICARGVMVDGQVMLVIDPAAPDLSACPYVVMSGAEVANSLFSFTAADGGLLSGAIVGCWAAAFAIRSVINIIKGSTDS